MYSRRSAIRIIPNLNNLLSNISHSSNSLLLDNMFLEDKEGYDNNSFKIDHFAIIPINVLYRIFQFIDYDILYYNFSILSKKFASMLTPSFLNYKTINRIGEKLNFCAAKLTIESTKLDCFEKLSYIYDFNNVEELRLFSHCEPIKYIPFIPMNLKILYISYNEIEFLPTLPDSLIELFCGCNLLASLPLLPPLLEILFCFSNKLSTLPGLPKTLKKLSCGNNPIKKLPILPSSLESIDTRNTQLALNLQVSINKKENLKSIIEFTNI